MFFSLDRNKIMDVLVCVMSFWEFMLKNKMTSYEDRSLIAPIISNLSRTILPPVPLQLGTRIFCILCHVVRCITFKYITLFYP